MCRSYDICHKLYHFCDMFWWYVFFSFVGRVRIWLSLMVFDIYIALWRDTFFSLFFRQTSNDMCYTLWLWHDWFTALMYKCLLWITIHCDGDMIHIFPFFLSRPMICVVRMILVIHCIMFVTCSDDTFFFSVGRVRICVSLMVFDTYIAFWRDTCFFPFS